MDTVDKHYLTSTIVSLQKAYHALTEDLQQQDMNFKDLQKYMMDYKSELDKFEVYDYQQTLHMIDKQGFAQAMEREQIKKLIDSPYFGNFKFVYEGDPSSNAESFYIGRFGFQDEDGQTLIYDWRAPVCNMYYEFEPGPAYYHAMDRQFDGELVKKKQFKIEQGKIVYALESSVTIQDQVLQDTLNTHANDKMKTIVTSIQREQNKIVRNDIAQNVIIQGVAGSGKTAVALHRIAYLLYKHRDTLKAERIFILSPNKVFGDYISSVLPELGEAPIRSFTLDELTTNLLPSAVTFTSFEEETKQILMNPTSPLAIRASKKSNAAFVEKLQSYLYALDQTLLKKQSLRIADTEFSAQYLQNRFLQYRKEPVLKRLQLISDDILQALKAKYGAKAKLSSKNEVVKRLKTRLQFLTPLAIYRDFCGKEFHFKNKHFEFNDVYPYLYVQHYFKDIKTYELVQHFVLDEMQDYTPIQFAVLAKVFDCKRTIIGDFSQALLPYETMTKKAFSNLFDSLDYVQLTTTYRSSYEIAMYAKKFMKHGDIHPIERHGKKPLELFYSSEQVMLEQIQRAIKNDFKTTAIICKTERDVQRLSKLLRNVKHYILNGQTETFETGLILTTIQYAKGLEFDAVIVPYINESNYSTVFEKGLLYIATTRAMHELTLLIDQQQPSPLL